MTFLHPTRDRLAGRDQKSVGGEQLDPATLWGAAYLRGEPHPAAAVGDVITLVADAGELRRALLADRASFDHYCVVRIQVVAIRLHKGVEIEIDIRVLEEIDSGW